ncbi:hypothetical protein INS49_005334 [Diaporthe citri]|uniref:uncharacterized protein n=1 Tax=Diaporthe citri TaxID=83186 RepID=UPI001C7E5DF2|nr:uncharacterized protein INS49_005334 [Diaporthe citri]KAG6353626.1 hypothetical protein INS49_005334 [Diaporthe citri]
MAGDPEQETAYRSGDLRLFESGLFSDIVVECGPRSWNLHRNILCTRSVWFETAITGSYVVGQMKLNQDAFDGVIRIEEQDPEAVEVCLRYIYGAIDMATETRYRPVFKFCAELYRSADFFLLEPLLPVVQRHIGDYCDEKTRWMWTRGNMTEDYRNEKKALIWVDDLKAAILETDKWNTPVISFMLMEFVWASNTFLTNYYSTYIGIRDWLRENARRFLDDMEHHCKPMPPFCGGWSQQL